MSERGECVSIAACGESLCGIIGGADYETAARRGANKDQDTIARDTSPVLSTGTDEESRVRRPCSSTTGAAAEIRAEKIVIDYTRVQDAFATGAMFLGANGGADTVAPVL